MVSINYRNNYPNIYLYLIYVYMVSTNPHSILIIYNFKLGYFIQPNSLNIQNKLISSLNCHSSSNKIGYITEKYTK